MVAVVVDNVVIGNDIILYLIIFIDVADACVIVVALTAILHGVGHKLALFSGILIISLVGVSLPVAFYFRNYILVPFLFFGNCRCINSKDEVVRDFLENLNYILWWAGLVLVFCFVFFFFCKKKTIRQILGMSLIACFELRTE